MGLQVLHHLPEGLLHTPATGLFRRLGGPTWIELEGRREPPLFISVLQHGNETTGWDALRNVLLRHGPGSLPRRVHILLGNLRAAAVGLRKLDDQPDFNRCWPGGTLAPEWQDHPFTHITRQVMDRVTQCPPFASIDLHNNTGLNPHYGALNRLDCRALHLATLFSRTVVYFETPKGVQSMAMAEYCPALTLECGQVGERAALDHAERFIEACLRMDHLPDRPVPPHDIDLFHTLAVIRVPEQLDFSFDGSPARIRFVRQLDHLNFRELPAGTLLAEYQSDLPRPLQATDEHGRDISEAVFHFHNGEIRLKRAFMPAMLTLDHRIVRQDCLCYFMERMPPAALPDGSIGHCLPAQGIQPDTMG